MTPRLEAIDVDLVLHPAEGTLEETASIEVRAPGATHLVFTLDEGLVVKRAATAGGVIDFRQGGDTLVVDVDPPLEGPRVLTFTIAGQPGGHSASEIGPARVVLSPATPWYPTLPYTQATASVSVHVPEGWRAVGPGEPASPSKWVTRKPVRMLAIAAAPGLRETAVPGGGGKLWVGGTGAPRGEAASRLAPAMAWFSGALAPYPFEAFHLVILPGFDHRVEGSGIVIVGRDIPLASDGDGADLLAGQWFGQLLAGDGAWMTAFSAWDACVFARDRALPLPAGIAADRAAYFQMRSGDVALASATASTPPAVLRGKGSAAPDMVRLTAGDRATFDAIREMFGAPWGPPLALADVREVMEKHAGRSLSRAFADWFERPGAPELAGTLRSFPAAGGGFRADIDLSQKRAAYALPLDIVIYGAGAERRETVELTGETTSVFYVVPFEPKRIEIDPQERIFRWK
jgi:hypothetical protein